MTQIFTSPIQSKPNAFNTISSGASSSRTIGTITRPHNGVDFAVPTGTDLASIGTDLAGKVIYAQLYKGSTPSKAYGNYVVIEYNVDGQIYQARYAHLESINVTKGQTVNTDTVIGKSGGKPGLPTSGHSKGEHLHFELVKVPKENVNPFGSYGQKPSDIGGNINNLIDYQNSSSTTPTETETPQIVQKVIDAEKTNSTAAEPQHETKTTTTQTEEQKAQTEEFIKSEDMKQTATFINELSSALKDPSFMSIMVARLAILFLFMFSFANKVMAGDLDIPKKDPKEQCRTMNSVYANFIEKNQNTDNVRMFYSDVIDGEGYSIIMLNQHGIISGILLGENDNENGRYYGYYYQNNLWIVKEKPTNYSLVLDIEHCKVKQLIIKSN